MGTRTSTASKRNRIYDAYDTTFFEQDEDQLGNRNVAEKGNISLQLPVFCQSIFYCD